MLMRELMRVPTTSMIYPGRREGISKLVQFFVLSISRPYMYTRDNGVPIAVAPTLEPASVGQKPIW